jgi:hypothetical protein
LRASRVNEPAGVACRYAVSPPPFIASPLLIGRFSTVRPSFRRMHAE